MKTSGTFTTHSFSIPVKLSQPTRIVIFGDVHRDSPNHAHRAWEEFLSHARSLKDAYFLGMGDYLDSTSTSERECLGHINSKMHETFRNDIQALQLAKVEMMAKELSFMKGRLIGLLNGNHYFTFQSGINTDQKLSEMLGCKYLGVSTFLRLYFDRNSRRSAVDIWAHHGLGSGRLLGTSLNRVDQMREHAEADVYIMGHDHKRGAVPASPRLHLEHSSRTGLQVKQRQQWLIRSGSFLASYNNEVSNYNVDAGRGPCSLGHVELLITIFEHGKEKVPETRINAIT